jgi:transcriptional antiterminator NusG
MAELTEEEIKNVIDDEHNKRWYVVNTYVGQENRVKDNLAKRAETMGIQDALFRIVVAEEPEIEIKKGKEVETMHNLFPGYIFVEMKMTDEAWYVVRNTPGVTGFIGSSGGGAKPFPVAPAEMESILRRVGDKEAKISVDFAVGDTVDILNGPFAGQTGTVSTMNDQTQVANVLINMFGRSTPTDLKYTDIKKSEEQ